jgi:hypothetical protein
MGIKLHSGFKRLLFTTSALLYASGVAYLIFDTFVRVHGEFGNEPHPLQATVLHIHGIVGLVFLFVFGHLYANHIRPGLRGKRRKLTGWAIFAPITFLALTVPGLYYFGNENLKNAIAALHTYVGLAVLLPFGLHLYKRR